MRKIKAKLSLYYNYTQVRVCSKVGFFSGLKTGWSNSPQTSNQAFLMVFTAFSQLKSTLVGLPRVAYSTTQAQRLTRSWRGDGRLRGRGPRVLYEYSPCTIEGQYSQKTRRPRPLFGHHPVASKSTCMRECDVALGRYCKYQQAKHYSYIHIKIINSLYLHESCIEA